MFQVLVLYVSNSGNISSFFSAWLPNNVNWLPFQLLYQQKTVSLHQNGCISAIKVNFIALDLHFLFIVNKYIELWL